VWHFEGAKKIDNIIILLLLTRLQMSIIEVFQASYEKLSSEQQELFKEEVLKEIREEFLGTHDLYGDYPITLNKALNYIGRQLSKEQYSQYKKDFRARFLNTNPFFERAWNPKDPGKMYTEKKEGGSKEIYFSIKGFEYWCMTQKTSKANAIKAYFSNITHNYHQDLKKENEDLKKKKKILIELLKKFEWLPNKSSEVVLNSKKYEMKEPTGKVYFIHEVGSEKGFKIGFTRLELEERLSEFQTGNLKELKVHKWVSYQECQKLEKHLHKCFAEKHIRGEWYDLNLEEVNDIAKFLESS
jgi:hypothetical protein